MLLGPALPRLAHALIVHLGFLALACIRAIVVAEVDPTDGGAQIRDGSTDALLGPGLLAEYFGNTELRGAPVLTRVEPRVSVFRDQVAPDPRVPSAFWARWTGALLPLVTGPHEQRLRSDDGSRLWIDGVLLID
jgi:hypothetical protein